MPESSAFAAPEHKRARQSLHGIAEWLLAGPQYERAATIRLRVKANAICTVDELAWLTPKRLSSRVGGVERNSSLTGTIAAVGKRVGIKPVIPIDLYTSHSPVGVDDVVD